MRYLYAMTISIGISRLSRPNSRYWAKLVQLMTMCNPPPDQPIQAELETKPALIEYMYANLKLQRVTLLIPSPLSYTVLNLLGCRLSISRVGAVVRRSARGISVKVAETTYGPSYLPGEVLRRHDGCTACRVCAQQIPPAAALTHGQRNQVVHETASEDPIAHGAGTSKAKAGEDLDGRAGLDALEEGRASVVEKIQDPDAGESLGHGVRENGAGGVRVHGLDLGGDIIELGEGIDGDEDVGKVQTGLVPEKHPHYALLACDCIERTRCESGRTTDAYVPNGVVRHEIHLNSMLAGLRRSLHE